MRWSTKILFRPFIGLLAALVFVVSCGTESRTFNNPNDPNADRLGEQGAAEIDNGAPTDESGLDSDTSATETCLTTTCSPKAGAVFDFANVFSITPSGCTGISQVRMFDTGSGLRYFMRANCGQRFGVYTFTTSYAGANASSLTLVSTNCLSSDGVTGFAVDKGSSGYLVANECKASTNAYATQVIAVKDSGNVGTPAAYETNTSSQTYKIAWNSAANTFGLARSAKFQRFSSSGAAVGGPIAIGISPHNILLSGGTWYLSNGSQCSKVNSSGTLECDNISLGVSENTTVSLDPSAPSLVSGGSGHFSAVTLNPTPCTGTRDFYATPTNPLSEVLSALSLNGMFGTIVFKTTSSLIAATYLKSGGAIQSEASVSGYSASLGSANIAIIQNRLYIAYDKDGGGYVSYSTQSVPP